MLLREAVQLMKSTRYSESKQIALVCSFEPLYVATYLQAFLAQRTPKGAPRVVTFGYDQLREGLTQTSTVRRSSPVLLCLSWEDLHPGLSWRSRGNFGELTEAAVHAEAQRLERQLVEWMARRAGAETYLVIPPVAWLPLHDACSPLALGPIALAASSQMWRIAERLTALGGRVLRLPPGDLNYRELLQSGCPFTVEDSEALAQHLLALMDDGLRRKKAIVTDLDGTLWAGVIGEDGPEAIRCRPEGKGYASYVLQKFLAKVQREGLLLAVCSKNNPDDVLPMFDRLEMPLRLSDFAAFRCNWEAKSVNVRAIADELHIGCEDMIVIENDWAEVAELQAHLPGLTVLRTPHDGEGWQALLRQLQRLCGTWRVSEEDRFRTASVAAERQRLLSTTAVAIPPAERHAADSLAHVRGLRLEVVVKRDAFADPRSLELINKTNQFNLTGRRLSQEEWLQWMETPGAFCLSARLRDRFGDFGTICVVTGSQHGETTMRLKQFVLSCRAFGRGVETLVLGELLRDGPWEWLCGPFERTGKNEPTERLLAQWGCQVPGRGEWRVDRRTIEDQAAKILGETGAIISVVSESAARTRIPQQTIGALEGSR